MRYFYHPIYSSMILVLAILFLSTSAFAETFTVDDCMLCHSDPDQLPSERPGLVIQSASYEHSIHSGLSCTDCHDGIDELPHPEKLGKVDCSSCHTDVQETYAKSIHGISRQTQESHQENAEAASCVSCHGSHDILPASDPKSRVHHHNLANTCISCHQDEALMHRHSIESSTKVTSYVFSIHGQANLHDPDSKAATCNNCHGWHNIQPAHSAESSVSREKVAKTCGECHGDVLEEFYGSVHGNLAKQGNPDVPVCTDCHGEHQIRSPENRESLVSKFHIAETCARCHEDPAIVTKYEIPISTPSTFYRKSVHGRALLSGKNEEAAACHDCHGHHSILGGYDPHSSVNKFNIPKTCGSCHHHEQVLTEYEKSTHAKAVRKGVRDAPVCSDCHGEHTIMENTDPDSPVYPIRQAKETCGRCHDSLVINRKFGMQADVVSTYLESYHGLASRLGATNVATCVSCHSIHAILPADDPHSTVNKANLVQTCATCHPESNEQFVAGPMHISTKRGEHWLLALLRRFYILMIILTIGGMLVHNFLIMFRHIRDKYRAQKGQPHVVRFTTTALIQHALLSVCFIILAVTGFSLSYPDSLYSTSITTYTHLGEVQRSWLHRIAGVGLALTISWNMLSLIFSRRGRQELKSLMLGWSDLKNAMHNVAYHLGFTQTKPKFDRYDYTEKMEYWAFVWGSFVMIITGLMMWFPTKFSQTFGLSRIWIDAANVIHFYEAWLATLAILIWHFFFVLFHPEEYPMALSWLTGKLSVHSMEERHPLELERLKAEGKIQNPEN